LGRENAYTYTDRNPCHDRYCYSDTYCYCCCNCDCNGYDNSYSDCYPNTYSNANSCSNIYSDGDSNSHGDSYWNANTDPNADPDTHAYPENYSHAEAAPESNIQADSATSPDTAAAAGYEYTRCNGAAHPTASHYPSAAATFTATYSGAEALTEKLRVDCRGNQLAAPITSPKADDPGCRSRPLCAFVRRDAAKISKNLLCVFRERVRKITVVKA
jgi:hypothetical protein